MCHKHKWLLRDDGRYDCECGIIVKKEDIDYLKIFKGQDEHGLLALGEFWTYLREHHPKVVKAELPLPITIHFNHETSCATIESLEVKFDHFKQATIDKADRKGYLLVTIEYES